MLTYKICWFFILCTIPKLQSLHLKGTFSSRSFFKFLTRFGYQKVNDHDLEGTQGYLYGNISARNGDVKYDMYLVVVGGQYFVNYYKYRNRVEQCGSMFADIDGKAWDKYCASGSAGKEDILRRIPCPSNSVCVDEQNDKDRVIPGHQFTYQIFSNQPGFMYVSISACHRPRHKSANKECHWSYNQSLDVEVEYDIWLVNGNPNKKHLNPFEHQFSYEMHDVFEIYAAFLVLNLILLMVLMWVSKHRQNHLLIKMITATLIFEVSGMFFNLMNVAVFAFDGVGVPALKILGNFLDLCAQCTVMLEVLYIAKGWTITSSKLTRKPLLYTCWIIYSTIYIILFSFTIVSVDPVIDLDEWQTTPGYCILLFRMIIMIYFLYELQRTFLYEASPAKREFYIRVGAGFLVWFIYLPIVALLSPKIAALWRVKALLCIQSAADFIILVFLVHLFWPSCYVQYFDIPLEAPLLSSQNTSETSVDDESSEDEVYARQVRVYQRAYVDNSDSKLLPSGHI